MDSLKHCGVVSRKDTPTIMKKPIVLSTEKWNSIVKHIKKDEELAQQTDQEKKYKEYLKEGSRQMTKNWTNVIKKSGDDKTLPINRKKKQQEERIIEGQKLYNELKENDEVLRQEKISKAQYMIQRSKPGPRELESAAMLSEIIKGRDIQRDINAEFQKTLEEYNKMEDAKMQMQGIPWIEGEQKDIIEKRKRNVEYQKELVTTVKEEGRRKIEFNKRQKEQEKKAREEAEKEIQAQIEREKAALQRRKDAMRRNALEAMKMMEQRRLRAQLEDKIDDRIRSIHNSGKLCIEKIRKAKEKEYIEEKIRQSELNAQKVYSKQADTAELENQRYQKAIEEANAKLDFKEREKVQKEKMAKVARIQDYLEEVARQKHLKAVQCEQLRFDMANRLKNEEINEEFEKMRLQEKVTKAREIRGVLFEQMKEKQVREQQEKEMAQKCLTAENDDKFYIEYANKLIDDAKMKGRPILPLKKAVEKYKRENAIDINRQEPKHLKTNITIGTKKCTANSDAVIKYDLKELKQLNPRNSWGTRSVIWT